MFKEAISLVDVMYVTEINKEIDKANDLFPEFNEEEFNKNLVDKNKEYKRYIYTRKNI